MQTKAAQFNVISPFELSQLFFSHKFSICPFEFENEFLVLFFVNLMYPTEPLHLHNSLQPPPSWDMSLATEPFHRLAVQCGLSNKTKDVTINNFFQLSFSATPLKLCWGSLKLSMSLCLGFHSLI